MEHRKLTQAELVAEAKARFGDDPMKWAFQCPTCKDIATAQEFRDALKEKPRERADSSRVVTSDLLGQECIGCTLGALDKHQTYTGRGCDWSAYGLFQGPWEIVMPDGRIAWSFPLAPAPEDAK
ncbi:MAG: hypothetical protein HOY79_50000 [Streptomyces sp.]|nr:hypothetical protein [Streptomyces sp.]